MIFPEGLTVIVLDVPEAPAVWGRSAAERARRQLAPLGVQLHEGLNPAAVTTASLLLLRGDAAFHQSVLKGMLTASGTALVDDQGLPLAANVALDQSAAAVAWLLGDATTPPVGLRRVVTTDVASVYNAKLRRRDDLFALRITGANHSAIEKRIFLSTYKGVTDLVTKYWWPVPARIVTGWCVRLGLSPNFVTTVSGILVLIVSWLFARGDLGVGLLLAWPMTFLDTVDGKLARVTLTSSKFGDYFDHAIDLFHPPLWYYCWGLGLGVGDRFMPLFWVIIGGYIVGRLCEGYFAKRFGFHVHVWRRFDSRFRLVLARRNPNMIILTLSWIAGRPDIGLALVAAWTLATVLVQLVQIAQSVLAARHGPLQSWLEEPAPQVAAAS